MTAALVALEGQVSTPVPGRMPSRVPCRAI